MGELSGDRRALSDVVASAALVLGQARSVQSALAEAERSLVSAAAAVVEADVRQQLAALPLESLRGAVDGRVAWGALLDAGYSTVADIDAASSWELVACDGVGERSAEVVKAAAAEIAGSLRASTRPALRHERPSSADLALIVAVVRLDAVAGHARSASTHLAAFIDAAPSALVDAAPLRSGLRWLVTRGRRRLAAARATERLESLLAEHGAAISAAALGVAGPLDAQASLRAYVAEPARYLAVLDSRLGVRPAGIAGLAREIADAIEAFPLDVGALRVMLRRYQEFGAKFALQQRRVLLGDDMGLGKTIQALAAMAHLSAQGPGWRVLVVCPASVLVNWDREIRAKSDLVPVGPDAWALAGGVLVTTFERLRDVHVPASMPIGLLVVDEAHYVKNPDAQRTHRIRSLLPQCERVLFMTGTAIENRGAEFVDLVRMLDPAVAARLNGPAALVAPGEFRARVAPVYLRRNADEVLAELPPLIEVDEWEEMTGHDTEHYRRAVADGNFMAMRRAGFMAGAMRRSAKLDRLLELADQARESGHKVIVYSYFLDVLGIVMAALPGTALGPITGATPPAARQGLVDALAAAPPGTVLVSQIVAGGIGLNIQSASVVILCEPQVKPSTERQAIARARRMGQLKTVHVHRLLNPDGIDERIREILEAKEAAFDDYARDSDLADASGAAIDPRAALRIVTDERRRLGLPDAQSPTLPAHEDPIRPGA